MEFGQRFDAEQEMRWVRRILLDKKLSGHAKMELIYQQLPMRAPDNRLSKSSDAAQECPTGRDELELVADSL